jgi:glycosyltransferase involved in cell wall biosynthesis
MATNRPSFDVIYFKLGHLGGRVSLISRASVLVAGESGAVKELAAHAIHYRSNNKAFVVGPLPPPTHGCAVITRLMADRLKATADVRVIAISPDSLEKTWRYHVQRLWRVSKGLSALIWRRHGDDDCLYLAAAGGAGVFYDIAFATVARLFHYRLFVHHHVFSYINRSRSLTAVFFHLAGPDAVHICLCDCMGSQLKQRYAGIQHVKVVSNAAFMEPPDTNRSERTGAFRIGFLSNLIPDKGVDTVFELFRRLRRENRSIELIVGGPIVGASVQLLIDSAIREFGSAFDYRGRVLGPDKARFFDDINVFVFPTRYANEAQPLVVLEALRAGKPVIATARGCIADDLPKAAGAVFPEHEFIDASLPRLLAWANDPAKLAAGSREALMSAHHQFHSAQNSLEEILADMAQCPAR